jgi:hypothetical protein
VRRWSTHLEAFPVVRDTLAFDAFARCWMQEEVLLERIAAVLPAGRRASFDRLAAAWRARNRRILEQSMQVLAGQLAATAADVEQLGAQSAGAAARGWLAALLGASRRSDGPTDAAMERLAGRLDAAVRTATGELIRLHGLTGRATDAVLQRMGAEFAVDKAADPGKASLVGTAVSGALGGLAADLAAGGLTFGAGALLGGLLGAAGARGLASAYNLARGSDATTVRWSGEFLTGRVTGAVLRYLAVAHFGRGRGNYVEGEYPAHWRPLVESAVAKRNQQWTGLWARAASGSASSGLADALQSQLAAITDEVLADLYGSRA